MIDIFDIENITATMFYDNYISKNKPCVIKNFFKSSDSCYQHFLNNIDQFKTYKIGTINSSKFENTCYNDFMQEINKKTLINPNVR